MCWKPTFLGIGAEKSATTWCWKMLNEHPDVSMANPKEVDYFSLHYERGLRWYARHFADSSKPVKGEISPSYMDSRHASERIAAEFPDATILAVLRNPYDRSLSHLAMDVRNHEGKISSASFDRWKHHASRDWKYIRRSCYAEALRPYFNAFPQNRMRILFFDQMQSDTKRFLSSLFDAVGAEASYIPAGCDMAVNHAQDYRHPALFRMLRTVSRLAKRNPISSRLIELIHRKTRWRERTLQMLMTDARRPAIRFRDVFSQADTERLAEDIRRLKSELGLAVPDNWLQTP